MLVARGLSGNLFPVHPRVLLDELLTSWLTRTAHGNGMKLQAFFDATVGRGVPTMNRDYDRSVPEEHLRTYSNMTGVSIERLREATLRAYAGTFVDQVNTNTGSPWVLAQGVYHRKRTCHGLQYCPVCLMSDTVPYFRREWRLAFYVECERHHIQMFDACPQCDAPVVPFRVELGKRWATLSQGIFLCHACGFDLRRAPHRYIEFKDWQLAVTMRRLILLHWWSDAAAQADAPIATAEFFRDWSNLATLMRSARRYLNRLGPAAAVLSNSPIAPYPFGKIAFEALRVEQRIDLLRPATWALSNWPSNLLLMLATANVSRRRLAGVYATWSPRMRAPISVFIAS